MDKLDSELGHSYRHLKILLCKLLKGERPEGDEVDEARAAQHAEKLHKECSKGMMGDFKEEKVVDWLCSATVAENKLVAETYENE